MRLTDLFLALPLLPLLLVIIMLFRDSLRRTFGPETGIFLLVVFIIGITSWMQTARIVRGDVLRSNYGTNPWQDKNQVITSVSWGSRVEDARESLLRSQAARPGSSFRSGRPA